jgi:hypothetical protein
VSLPRASVISLLARAEAGRPVTPKVLYITPDPVAKAEARNAHKDIVEQSSGRRLEELLAREIDAA